MSDPSASWPPLIVADRIARVVKWRDALLTLVMWAFVTALLAQELGLFWRYGIARFMFGDTEPMRLTSHLARLRPFLLVAGVLGLALGGFSILTLRRHRKVLLLPQPEPLGEADQARRVGLDEAGLARVRAEPIVVFSFDPDGRPRIEAA